VDSDPVPAFRGLLHTDDQEFTMLGDASDFSPLDVLGALALNAGTTHLACKNPSFRVGWAGKDGEVKAWADYRFLGGVAATIVGQFGGPMVRRAGHDAAIGLLGSFVATETCRRHAIAKLTEAQAPAAIPAAAPAEAAPAPAPAEMGGNWAYGW
jgi:hypothetical protein